jgi:2,4-dienoyl-CoA reductase-like NADH-dependent reductase (Old Yellow Enzyme family)
MQAMHERFHYRTLEELQAEVTRRGLGISFQQDLSPLGRKVEVYGHTLPNSLGIHPMEGCDGTADGKPDELTFRRYERFARGGAGLLWFEATAVAFAGRANPRQLFASPENTGDLARLRETAVKAAQETFGAGHEPLCVLQLTHSGRYSKPEGTPKPIIAQHNPWLDAKQGIPADYPVITDDELERLEDEYVKAARVAVAAGYRVIDLKSCHRYLVSELLGAHARPGKYGGPFENRTRFQLNIIDKIRAAVGKDLEIAVRLNTWDGLPYPYGWGVSPATEGQEPGPLPVDLTDPTRLLGELSQRGVRLVSLSIANPYYNAHLTRPYDTPAAGLSIPEEHPLEGVARIFGVTRELQASHPELTIVGAGYSWLRQFFPLTAAANLATGTQKIAGVGREAFAYPDFARDLLEKGALDSRKVCIACSKCTDIMRDGGRTGCVVRDAQLYLPIWQEGEAKR